MNRQPAINLGILIGTIIIVVILIFVAVAAKYKVPVTSLLPGSTGQRSFSIPSPTYAPPGSGLTKSTGVSKITVQNGSTVYIVNGKFVSDPSYVGGLLQGDFVINEDPNNTRVTVSMSGIFTL